LTTGIGQHAPTAFCLSAVQSAAASGTGALVPNCSLKQRSPPTSETVCPCSLVLNLGSTNWVLTCLNSWSPCVLPFITAELGTNRRSGFEQGSLQRSNFMIVWRPSKRYEYFVPWCGLLTSYNGIVVRTNSKMITANIYKQGQMLNVT
jgi:hypothetical protein